MYARTLWKATPGSRLEGKLLLLLTVAAATMQGDKKRRGEPQVEK